MSDNETLRDLTAPLAWTTAISSTAALAAVLRSRGRISFAQAVGAILTSAVVGAIVLLLLADRFTDNVSMLIGVSALAGAGGASTLDLLLQALRARAAAER